MKTFNYESRGVKYNNCFFDIGAYEKGKMSLAIYGYVENDKDVSHISNITVNVDEILPENQVVIDDYTNTNLITFLLELGIVKRIVKRIPVKLIQLSVVELDLEKLKEYSYEEVILKYAS